jgi:CubicO group peptidase (beta-lactamase class C family)
MERREVWHFRGIDLILILFAGMVAHNTTQSMRGVMRNGWGLSPGLRSTLLIALASGSSPALADPMPKVCRAPAASLGGVVNAHTRYVEHNLLPAVMEAGAKPLTLADRMKAYGVPGISVAVIHNGKLDWARGWGVRDSSDCKPVTTETVFQSASISKAVTAALALRLVEQGKLSLDQDINRTLRSWQLPTSEASNKQPITLRHLLSHTAGLNVHGFPGYRAGSALPTPVQILNGQAPANTEAVRSTLAAGAEWRYSGGGYVVAQVALQDVSGRSFAELAEREIFRPIGMRHSAYAQPLSGSISRNAASGHNEGKVIPGKYHVYPELAPAGLWTSASDLALFLLDIQKSASSKRGTLLSPSMTKAMLSPVKGDWGLGPALSGAGTTRRFGHDGVNEGFQSTMVAYVHQGKGIVVLTNGAGKRLADEIVRAVATDYGWTELASKPVIEATLPTAALAALAGPYEGGGLSVFLDLRDGHLFAQTGGPEPERLVAISSERFKTSASGIVVEFVRDAGGKATGFRIVEGGPPITLTKVTAMAVDPLSVPLFVRGSMNGWSIAAPLRKSPDGSLFADLLLSTGEHQLKIGAEDWSVADYGLVGSTIVKEPVDGLPLILRGGNVRLSIATPATYRFTITRGLGGPALSIRQLAK